MFFARARTMWFTREKGLRTDRETGSVHRRGQPKRTNAGTGVFQKLAARLVQVIILLWSHRSAFHDRLVRFNKMFATVNQQQRMVASFRNAIPLASPTSASAVSGR